jgi:hypothetical protein
MADLLTIRYIRSGTFSLLIRQGDDTSVTPTIVLETWTNLSMDPTAPNYVARVIGNQYRPV